MGQVETAEMNINKVRDLAIQVAREQKVADADAADARGAIRRICREASLHGLTTAEVVRAIFRPVLEARSRGCNCPTCIARRERHIREEMLETTDVGYQPPSSVI